MTTREFAASIIEEHFIGKIDHLKSGWGHNFNREFMDRKDGTYVAISLILRYWNKEEGGIDLFIAWLKEGELSQPWTLSYLGWNLYYSLVSKPTARYLRIIDQGASMFSLLRSIELNGQLPLLEIKQQEILKTITEYIINNP